MALLNPIPLPLVRQSHLIHRAIWRFAGGLRSSGAVGAILWLVCGLGVTGCRINATRQVSDPAPAVTRLRAGGSIQAEADRLVNPLLADGEVFGMTVGVLMPDGSTHCFGYGKTGRPGDRLPPTGDDLFQIGSLTKLLAETLFVRLEEQGRLHDDDTVRDILPANIPVSKEAGRLTLYDLATHTSGLPREPFTRRQLVSLFSYFLHGENLYAHLTVPYLLDYLRDCHPHPQTPRHYVYSNFGAGLLTYLITEKTGQSAEAMILDDICHPLGMTNSFFALAPSQTNRLTVGHVGNQACWKPANHPLAPWDMGALMRPISGLYSSANDLLCFAKANLGMIPTPLASALAATHQVKVKSSRGGETLGWIVSQYDQGRRTITFKDGVMSGYCAFIGLDLDAHIAVVVLANKFNWDEKVGMNLLLRLAESSVAPRPERVAGRF